MQVGNGQLSTDAYGLQCTMKTTNVYFGGKLILKGTYSTAYPVPADYAALAAVAADRLGSIGKFYPYGQEKPSATTNDTEKFTGYFRDQATGLDYADQRYHQPGVGRFMSADPYKASAGANDPGSWNRYAYTRGDPVNRIDSSGLDDTPTFTVTATGYLDVPDYFGGMSGMGARPQHAIIEPPMAWDRLSDDCKSAIEGLLQLKPTSAGITTMLNTLARAKKEMSTLQTAAANAGIDPALLAAIGIKESHFEPVLQRCPIGVQWGDPKCSGAGVFQIDLSQNPSVALVDALT